MREARGFTLVELLVVIGVVALLIALLMPALARARDSAKRIQCAANLQQMGVGLAAYVSENRQRLPMVIEPYWIPPSGDFDFTVDPKEKNAQGDLVYPFAFINVMANYIPNPDVLICPAATFGYPYADPKVTYRFSAANNSNGVVTTYEHLDPDQYPYPYSRKYLNYRKYKLDYVLLDPDTYLTVYQKGVGPFYLARDFALHPAGFDMASASIAAKAPHRGYYNQLKLDFSVSLENEKNKFVGFVFP